MEEAGAKASRLFLQRFSTFFESLPNPADASGAYRPDPQATTKPAPGPPSLKGYRIRGISLDFPHWPSYISSCLGKRREGFASEGKEGKA